MAKITWKQVVRWTH